MMNNDQWIDCHVHVLDGSIEELKALAASQRAYGYSASNFLSVEGMGDATQNALGILFKCLDPNHYAFGSLHYRFEYDFAQEVQTLWDIGFDGLKMIENKPTERKKLGYAQDDPRYDAMYRRAAQLDMPLLVHINDPRDFWDIRRAPAWAVEAGYAYVDGTYVSFEQILRESVHMMEKHPNLRVCFAHMMFLSDNSPQLEGLMERFPNLHLDITSGTEMYHNFTHAPVSWKRFFYRYGDRILYGTDNCNRVGEHEQQIGDTINDLQKRFLTEDVRFPLWDDEIQGFGLEKTLVQKITRDNFRRFASPVPRPLERKKATAYVRNRLDDPRFCLTDRERELLDKICSLLE